MFVTYSPVCDTDKSAYLEYLRIVRIASECDVARSGTGAVAGATTRAELGCRCDWCMGAVARESCCVQVEGCGRLEDCSDEGAIGEVDVSGSGAQGSGCEWRGSGGSGSSESPQSGLGAGCAGVDGDGRDSVRGDVGAGGDGARVGCGELRGKNYQRNRRKREIAKVARKSWRSGSRCVTSVPSLSGSVCTLGTVDTRTAEEIEAARTFSLRRSAENRVAVALADHKLASLCDEDKTRTVKKLQAQRLAQRINEATEKAQASYARCDKSLKSLGSTGSAGEFALKQSLKSQDALDKKIANLEEQLRVALQVAGPEGWSAVAAVPEPEPVGIRDVMDEPNEHWSEEETVAYYDILNEESIGNYDTDWASYFPKK